MRTHNRIYKMLLFFVVVTIIVIPFFAVPVQRISLRLTELSVADSVTFRDEVYENVVPNRLADAGITHISEGDVLIFNYTLPDTRYEIPALLIKTRGAALTVYLDGEEIFSHDDPNDPDHDSHTFMEWGSHFVDLPVSYAGKTLSIRLDVQSNNSFGGVYVPHLGSHTDLMQYLAYLGLLPLLLALFMCAYGVFYIAISLFFAVRFKEMREQILIAALCLICGIWLLCHHELLLFLVPGGHTMTLEYLLRFIAVPIYYLYLQQMQLPLRRKSHTLLAAVLSISSLAILLASLIFGIRINMFLAVYGLIGLAGLIVVMRFFTDTLRSPDTDPSVVMQMSGLAVLLFCILLHLGLYYLEDFTGRVRGIYGRNVMTFGFAIFLESQLINYFVFVTRRFAERMERSELEEMAYRDFLTKLPNRTDAERVFQQMTKTTQDFCVVMFDLNDLKDVNDKNGHDAGDHLLVEFAQALRVAFDEGSYLARIGGDEFVAVLEGVSTQTVERHLRTLTDALHRLDILEPHIAHSVSYGYAFRHECAENSPPPSRNPLQMVHGPADFSDVDYNFTLNRRRQEDAKGEVKQENVNSSESKYATGDDILQRAMSLADKRMYERKKLWRKRRNEEDVL